MLSQFIAYTLTLTVGLFLSRNDFRPAVSGRLSKEMLIFSAPLILGSVSIWLLGSSDRFFLLRLSTLDELGLYSLGSRLASVVLFAVTAFQMAWPQFALSSGSGQNIAYTNARIFTYYVFVSILLVLGLSLFTPEILDILATNSYAGAGSVVLLLSCSFLFYGCYFVFVIILSLTKRTLSILPVTIPPLLVSLVLNYLLVPSMGGMGSAIASASSYFLMALLTFLSADRLFHIDYEWSRIVKMISVAIPVVLAGKLVSFDSLFVNVGAKFLLILAYLGALVSLRFFLPIELETMKTLARRPFHLRG
jgi:O-antigen/teichoic acid export membrane protein